MKQKSAVTALNDLDVLFRYLSLYGVMDKVRTCVCSCHTKSLLD